MVRRTNVAFAIDGILYDMDMWSHNGTDISSQLHNVYKRLKRLSIDIKSEQYHNLPSHVKKRPVCCVCGADMKNE